MWIDGVFYPLSLCSIEGEGDGAGAGGNGGEGAAGDDGKGGGGSSKGDGDQGGNGGMASKAYGQNTDGEGEGAGNNGSGSGDGGKGEGDGGDGGAYRPEGLPEHLAGDSERTTIDKLFTAYKGARTELAKKQGEAAAPESPDKYTLPEDSTINQDDEALPVVQKVFHEAGLSQKQFEAVMGKIGPALQEAGLLEADLTEEQAAEAMAQELEKLGPNGQKQVDSAVAWLRMLEGKGVLNEKGVMGMMLAFGDKSDGIKALNAIRTYYGEKNIPMGDPTVGDGSMTEAELYQAVADPRYKPGTEKYDPAFRKKVDDQFRKFYGEEQTQGGRGRMGIPGQA